jgi:hypothetical protein
MRAREDDPTTLAITSYENRTGVLVIPVEYEASVHGKTQLTFESAGDQHFLSRIQTQDHVFNLYVPSRDTLLAATPNRNGSASDSSGN